MPEMPTIAEAGLPGYEARSGSAYDGANRHAQADHRPPQCRGPQGHAAGGREGGLGQAGAVPMPMAPADFDKYLHRDIEKWAHVVKVSGAKAE
jgi:hypothetical protein